jgi:hypothetical protein
VDAFHKGGYGAIGVALWIIAVYGLQIASAASRGELHWKATLQTVAGVSGLIVFYLVLGAAAPFVADAQSSKEAVAEGLGWQGIFGQFVKK